MANQNGLTTSIPVTLEFTEQGPECVSPAFWEALRNANLRISLPADFLSSIGGGSTSVAISTLQDNITRLDGQGAIYTPGLQIVEVEEQTVTLTSTTAPGVPVTMVFSLPSVPDLETAINNITFSKQPPEVGVSEGPWEVVGSNLQKSFYRVDDGSSAPYPEVVIKGRGRLIVVPAPTTA